MKVVLSNPTNNAFARSAASGFADAGILSEYYSSVAVFPNDMLDRLARLRPFSELARRRFDPKLKPFVRTSPWRELGRHLAAKANLNSLIRHETGVFHIDTISKLIDKKVARNLTLAKENDVRGVYSYEDIAVHSFREAKNLGLSCFYDLPIGYWRTARTLLQIEREKWPAWGSTLTGFNDSEDKLARKDEELRLADAIFVASSFTASTLKDYPGELAPVHIIPYGFPEVQDHQRDYAHLNGKRPLKLLFVGGLSQRKGLADVLKVVDELQEQVSLTLVGHKMSNDCEPLNKAVEEHTWFPTLPHEKVLELMRNSDVLLFPSLFEGFGLVITEAMSQGTPVITTERTAGPDIMTHDRDGWLIDAGDTAQLRRQLEVLIQNPKRIADAGKEARETAKNWTWKDYGSRTAEIIAENLKTGNDVQCLH